MGGKSLPLTKMNALSIILIIAAFALVIWAGTRMVNEADRVHNQLRRFRFQAEICTSREDLLQLKSTLKMYATKECYNRHYTSHAQEVLDFINGRLHSPLHEQNR
jgi:hypothetical protein